MKNLVIISRGKNTWLTLYEQLTTLLGDQVNVSGYYIDGKVRDNLKGDLTLVSSRELLPEVRHLIAADCPIIVARRSINYHEVEKLFDIPDGTDVLLVNDVLSAANETISLLLALGIDHLRYHPYAPGIREYPHVKIAVTPGEPDYAPPCIEDIVDIKSRIIDITTLVEIVEKLYLLDERANLLSANYLRDVIQLIKTNKQSARISQKLNSNLQTIINTVNDGIIAVDDTNRISVINPVAEVLLSLNSAHTTGKNVDDILSRGLKDALVQASKQQQDKFIRHNNRQIVINTATIYDDAKPAGFVYTFKDVSEIQRLEEELRRKTVKEQHIARYTLKQIVGDSSVIRNTIEKACSLAGSDSPILIQGESGTGKELLAQGIHNASSRKNGPFVAVNFAALTESLIESELFGYDEGSFTGARRGGAAGLFEQAHKGTIFLDEIGDSPLASQVRILRVLQEKQVRRIGGSRNIPVDVRVISATNQDMKALVARGLFRKDLYYRLNVLPIFLPSLREREADILLLAKHYYENFKAADTAHMPAEAYFSRIKPYFLAYDWPGNIRELQNVVEYLVNICPFRPPAPDLLSEEMQHSLATVKHLVRSHKNQPEDLRDKILQEITRCNKEGLSVGRRSLASSLGLPENTLRKMISQLKMSGHIIVNRGRRGLQLPGITLRS